jgi:hypothetical protein
MVDPRQLRRPDVPDWSLAHWIRWRYCWWLPTRSELRYAYYDLRAWFGGWCNHCPKEGDGGPGSGYAHWRCQLRRRHTGLHRAVNYVWTDDGQCDYLPTNPRHTDQRMASPWARKHLGPPYWYRIRQHMTGGAR